MTAVPVLTKFRVRWRDQNPHRTAWRRPPGLPSLDVLILAIILLGLVVGAAAQLVLGRSGAGIDWGLALAAGLIGSFVGGLLGSLIAGDGLASGRAD